MKIAAKLFLVLTIIASVICTLIFVGTSCSTCTASCTSLGSCAPQGFEIPTSELNQGTGCLASNLTLLLGAICLIPGIVCFIAYKMLSAASYKHEIIIISIVTLIFGNPIAGILMLLIPEREL